MSGWLAGRIPTTGEGHSQRWLQKLWKERATSPSSEAQYWCIAATTRHVFARRTKQTLFHLLHRTPIVILIAFTTSLFIVIWTFFASNEHLTSFTMGLFPMGNQCHVVICSIRLEQDVFTEARKACWDKQTCWTYCGMTSSATKCMQMWFFVLQNLDLFVAQSSIEWHVSFNLSILWVFAVMYRLLTLLMSPKDSKCKLIDMQS